MSEPMPHVAVGQVWRHVVRGHRVEIVDLSPVLYGRSRAHGITMRHLDAEGPDYVLFQAAIITAIEVTPAECRFGPNCPLCGQESEEA